RDGGQRCVLDVLAPAEAGDLLARLLGPERVAAQPVATTELARLCGYLPLALRIAAANLAAPPDEPVNRYTARLRTGDRLAALRLDGDEHSTVGFAFDLSYRALPAPARATFRLLGLAPGVDLAVEAAAALVAATTADIRPSLDQLAAGHLV